MPQTLLPRRGRRWSSEPAGHAALAQWAPPGPRPAPGSASTVPHPHPRRAASVQGRAALRTARRARRTRGKHSPFVLPHLPALMMNADQLGLQQPQAAFFR